MRWRYNGKPYDGKIRLNGGFLLLPKRIGAEYRWLEHAKWLEQYNRGWHPIKWVSLNDSAAKRELYKSIRRYAIAVGAIEG